MSETSLLPLHKLQLLRLNRRLSAVPRKQLLECLAQADEALFEIVKDGSQSEAEAGAVGKGNGFGFGSNSSSAAPRVTIPLLCSLQYSEREASVMVETVLSVLDSLGSAYGTLPEDTGNLGEPPVHLFRNDVELKQCEQLDDIALWREALMSSVLQE